MSTTSPAPEDDAAAAQTDGRHVFASLNTDRPDSPLQRALALLRTHQTAMPPAAPAADTDR